MTDTDATSKRRHVADPLREYAESTALLPGMSIREVRDELQRLADQIDRDHEHRMEQQSYELRKAFCRYMGGVLDDYRHGMKRKRTNERSDEAGAAFDRSADVLGRRASVGGHAMSDTESFKSILELARAFFVDNEWSWGNKICARLKAAHEREIAQARDPQRLRGTKPDTFNGAIEALREFRWQHATNDEDAIPYINAVKEMHDREIRDTAQQQYDRGFRDGKQQQYHRGFEDGRHSMDAEHRAVAMRLRALPLDGGSHENLSQIARAVTGHCGWGWTKDACAALRDKLIDLMGGVSDDTCGAGCGCATADCDGGDSGEHEEVEHGGAAHDCADDSRGGSCGELVHMDGLTTYDVLDNERRKAIAELRKLTINSDYYGNYQRIARAIGTDYDGKSLASECVRDRLIHLLGGDQHSSIDVMNSYEMRIEKLVRQRDEAQTRLDAIRGVLDAEP